MNATRQTDDFNDPIDDLIGSPTRTAPVSPPAHYVSPTFLQAAE